MATFLMCECDRCKRQTRIPSERAKLGLLPEGWRSKLRPRLAILCQPCAEGFEDITQEVEEIWETYWEDI